MMFRRYFMAGAAATALPPVPQPASLGCIAATKGILFGSAVTCADLWDAPDYRDLVVGQCRVITPGLEAKWGAVEPQERHFQLAQLNRIVAFAEVHGMALHMHNLLWAVGMPAWTVESLRSGRGASVMACHIAMLAGAYRGRVHAWDVVNEPVDPRWPCAAEGLSNSPWRRFLGPDYVADALHAAHAADPHARLLINDDDLEYDLPDREEKRTIYLRLIEAWLRAGAPLHGFGLEAHLKPWLALATKPYRRFLRELAGFGLKLYITELDVCDRNLPAEISFRDDAAAAYAARYLDLALDEPAVCGLIVWGLSDRYTYMNHDVATRRTDGLPSRPCLFDSAYRPKRLYDVVAHALCHAPAR
jgi:endo-1,4-beta-xylanase